MASGKNDLVLVSSHYTKTIGRLINYRLVTPSKHSFNYKIFILIITWGKFFSAETSSVDPCPLTQRPNIVTDEKKNTLTSTEFSTFVSVFRKLLHSLLSCYFSLLLCGVLVECVHHPHIFCSPGIDVLVGLSPEFTVFINFFRNK